ncbi:MAG: tetratricopeptide repeat protein [Bacteroidota bacterium]
MKKPQAKKQSPKKSPKTKGSQSITQDKEIKYFNAFGFAILIILGSIVYSNSFACSFHYDDFFGIVDNATIRNLYDVNSWWHFSANRPMAIFSYVLNYHFYGLDVRYWHYVNLIVHLITACLVWRLTLLIFATPTMKNHSLAKHKNSIALFTALLFVSHPLATQSVTYIIQRAASMVALFYLLSLLLYVKARLAPKANMGKYLLYAASLVSGVFALLTKENAFTLPFAMVLFDIFFIRKKKITINFKDYRLLIVLAALAGAIIIIGFKFSFSIFNSIPPNESHTEVITPLTYLYTQFGVILKYIQLLFLPVNQMVDYDIPVATSFFHLKTLFSFTILLLLFVLGIFMFKKQRLISFGIFWFFLTLAVESSIVPINDLMFEHRTYLPSVGFFLIITSTIFLLLHKKYKIVAITLLVVLVLTNSYLTYQRNKVWKNELTLWTDNVFKAPKLARPITNRGFAYRNLGMWDKALADYTKAVQLSPRYQVALCNRGVAYAHFEQWNKAIADYSAAIKLSPNFTDAYSNRSAAYGKIGKTDDALKDISKAIELNGNYFQAYSNRGNILSSIGKPEQAIADYTKAIALNPTFIDAHSNRGNAYGMLKNYDKAIADYSKAIELNPNFIEAYNNRGITYGYLSKWQKAEADFTIVIKINPKFKQAYVNRGVAYANLGQWDKAIADYTSALAIDPNYTVAFVKREQAYKNLNNKNKK